MKYNLNNKIMTKKPHPCGNNIWEIVRVGADIKIKCEKCSHIVMIPLCDFDKKVKKVLNDSQSQ